MEIPDWFGVVEYYWLLRTIVFCMSIWVSGLIIKAEVPKTTLKVVTTVKKWYVDRKKKREVY